MFTDQFKQLMTFTNWTFLKKTVGVFFLLACFSANAQDTSIKGTVTDSETGETLPGVSVLVKGTSTGTITDLDGQYTVSAPVNSTLVFSFIGYTQSEELIGNRKVIDVGMNVDVKSLEAVVVIGYGTQRAEAVTGSVVSMGGKDMREIPAANISQALQGRLAGVDMSQVSSKPGANMQIRIRGTRSLTADNEPLVVLDGIPFVGSISDINPNDIKSIDILKDASATAIYGSRGANGVILVTTNSGKRGQQARFTYNSFYGIQKIFAKYDMMDGKEFAALRAAAGQYQNTADESDDVNTDWQDMLYQTGKTTSHDLGISGGTQTGSYSFNVGYYFNEGVIPMQNFSRYSMRGSLDQEVGKYVRLGFVTNNNFSVTKGDNLGPGGALARTPITNPYNADGTLKTTVLEQTSGAQWVYTKSTLEALGDKYVNLQQKYGSYNTVFAEVKIPGVEGLKFRTNVGLNLRTGKEGYYQGVGVFSGNPKNPSNASLNNELTTSWAIENLLTYDKTFAGKHNINFTGLYSVQQTTNSRSRIAARNIPADHFQFYNMGQALAEDITINPADQWYTQRGLESYMGRVMYSYDDRYMVSATVRADAASVLAPGHQWHTYPAISAGWNIARESFMQGVSAIDLLKLRVGYGQTSNQSVNPYKTLGLLGTRPYNYGSTNASGNYVTELPSPGLGWEYSSTINYAVDFGILNRRLTGTLEYYIGKTEDVLMKVGLPATAGVGSYTGNVASTENRGVELTLNGLILDNKDGFTLEAGLNVYANRNKITSLASGQDRDVSNQWFVGYPIDVIYDYKKIGLWQEGESDLLLYEPGGNPGMIKVQYTGDYNDDGTPTRAVGADDRIVQTIFPKFQGGFNTRLSYKGFELSAVAAFKHGGTIVAPLYGSSGYLNTLNGRAGNNVRVDYWTPTNTDARYPKPGGIQSSDNPKYGQTTSLFDGSYLKMRTITLGYNFNQSMLKKSGIENLRLYCTVQNPFVMFSPFTKATGLDPETNSKGDENVAVAGQQRILIVGTNTPSTRNYVFGVNLTF
jgi:TonB-dependent starch-binding outer membrane protein SusC